MHNREKSFLAGLSRISLSAVAALLLLAPPAALHADTPGEYQVKAAYLYNFAKFIDWPPAAFHGPDSELALCVVGDDALEQQIRGLLSGKSAQGRPIVVRKARPGEELRKCGIVFVTAPESHQARQIAGDLAGSSALLVGESDDFIAAGGMINFISVEGRVRFEISPVRAALAGLSVSAKLLALAKIVN